MHKERFRAWQYLEEVPGSSAQVIVCISRILHRQHVGAVRLVLLCINLVVEEAPQVAADAHILIVQAAPKEAQEVY